MSELLSSILTEFKDHEKAEQENTTVYYSIDLLQNNNVISLEGCHL